MSTDDHGRCGWVGEGGFVADGTLLYGGPQGVVPRPFTRRERDRVSTVLGQWRATYAPGDWVLLSGPTSLVLLEPPSPERSSMINQLWQEVVASSSMSDLAGRLATFSFDSLPSFAAFFWTEDGMRSLVRGSVSVVDLGSGVTVAQGEGIQTWTEVGLQQVSQVLIEAQSTNGTQLEMPLIVGAARASSVRLDASPEARVSSPQRLAEPDAAPAFQSPAEAPPARREPAGAEPLNGSPVDVGSAGGAPVGGAPLAGAVVAGAPVGGVPVGSAPVGGAPVGGAPVGAEFEARPARAAPSEPEQVADDEAVDAGPDTELLADPFAEDSQLLQAPTESAPESFAEPAAEPDAAPAFQTPAEAP
ncbi:MAG TPA: hypothetical protein VNT24_06985, partial [Propionibacteriaceae bacterium]|nr:hypothetical protein [Propionibacteriaceae bacterium]